MTTFHSAYSQSRNLRSTRIYHYFLNGIYAFDQLLEETIPKIRANLEEAHVYKNERLIRSLTTASSALLKEHSNIEPGRPSGIKELPPPIDLAIEAIYDLQNILTGINPITGEDLPEDHTLREPFLNQAFKTAIWSLKRQMARRKEKAAMSRSGERWSEKEIETLLEEFDSGLSIPEIAQKHRRGCLSVMIRIKRFRAVRPDLWGAGSVIETAHPQSFQKASDIVSELGEIPKTEEDKSPVEKSDEISKAA